MCTIISELTKYKRFNIIRCLIYIFILCDVTDLTVAGTASRKIFAVRLWLLSCNCNRLRVLHLSISCKSRHQLHHTPDTQDIFPSLPLPCANKWITGFTIAFATATYMHSLCICCGWDRMQMNFMTEIDLIDKIYCPQILTSVRLLSFFSGLTNNPHPRIFMSGELHTQRNNK